MKYITDIEDMQHFVRQWKREHSSKQIGLVPTMGFLHAGHLSLVREAKQKAQLVIMSIFVNPLQFGPSEDYEQYPRDSIRDSELAMQAGVDVLFTPQVTHMYPETAQTTVNSGYASEVMCGRSRPGHFDGVATIVLKLLLLTQADDAFFGLKDAQQVAIVEQIVNDLNVPVRIHSCPIIRESDGLALSSRNVYLSEEQRKQAIILNQALNQAQVQIEQGERQINILKQHLQETITAMPLARIDYIEIRTYPTLMERDNLDGRMILAVAVWFGTTRLIDNKIIDI